ncbi:MAG: isoleucine--tRNA ligase [Halobacteria archaeon]
MPGPIRALEPAYRPADLEREVQALWDRNRICEKVRKRPGPPFFFVDGPPYTTGAIHLGTAWNKVIKDAVLRHRTMAGFRVSDTPGWDMHGLPIEVKVEEELGFTSKKQIEELGVGRFVSRCKAFAEKNRKEMTRQFQRLGVWMDWERPYRTVEPGYMEAAWSTLKAAYEAGLRREEPLLEQNYRVVNQCPRCETALAEAEVEYETITDPSIYVKFPIVPSCFGENLNASLLVWTTTPWTLPGNMAVAVRPDIEYAEVRRGNEVLIVASSLLEKVPGLLADGARVTRRRQGRELVGLHYRSPVQPLLNLDADPRLRANPPPYSVLAADFVQTTEGTGCVHIAPVHGEDDYRAIRRWVRENQKQVPFFHTVNGRGRFTNLVPALEGQDFREGNRAIVESLRQTGALFREEPVSHRYGHCWRCKNPLLFLATDQWFLKVSRLRDKMKAEAGRAQWVPDWAGSARFADFIGEARDWCISRQRYWGIPLPIWRCDKCHRIEVVGTRRELQKKTGRKVADLHRPSVDPLTWKCGNPGCGGAMKRVPDIFDVWFDSAVASWAVQGWPAMGGKPLPSDFVCEGHDQTRGWFFSQLGASVSAFGRAPYKTVLMHGFTLDEAGRKMSKSLGNVVEPGEVAGKFGADALRWAVLSAGAPWEDLRFSMAMAEGAFRSLNILYNAVRFLQSAGVPAPARAPAKLRVEDRWLLSRLHAATAEVTAGLESFHLHKATRALQGFYEEDLSRWYIPLVRKRLGEGDPAAAWSLATALDTAVRLLAPFAPFLAERLYGALPGRRAPSVHLAPWPKPAKRQPRIEEAMAVARRAVEAAWRARQKTGRKLRWPVARVTLVSGAHRALVPLRGVLGEQTNAKEVALLPPGAPLPDREVEVRPLPGRIGPAFKQRAQEVIEALKAARLVPSDAGGRGIEITLGGERVRIPPEMFEMRERAPEGVAVEPFEGGQVVVDGRLTPELEAEGWAREVVRRVQETRKTFGLTPAARAEISLRISDPRVAAALSRPPWPARIAAGVRASRLAFGKTAGRTKEWDLEEWRLAVGIRK